MLEFGDRTGGYTLSENNSKLIVMFNIASACWHHGFHFTPLRCTHSETDPNVKTRFSHNIAHSISGYGAIAANVEDNDCTIVKNFAAYKVTEASIMLGGASEENEA